MSDWSLADGWLLWFLGPIWVLWVAWSLWLTRARQRSGRTASIRVSSLEPTRGLAPAPTVIARRAVRGLRYLAVALLLLALARPQVGRTLTQVETQGIDIVLALDTSGSMQALDLDADRPLRQRRTRLDVTREVVKEFIDSRPTDQIGLVVFGEEAFTQCPLTLDHRILSQRVEEVEIGIAGDRTAIGSALGTAVKRLRESQADSKVIVLLTDGRNNAGALSPRQAAEVAATYGMKVYTVAAGTRGKAPFIVDSVWGERVIEQQVEIDETLLEEIAATTGGLYFRAEDSAALRRVYEEIDLLEKTEIQAEVFMEYDERFASLVWPALALLLLEVVLLGTRLRKLP